MVKKKTLYKDSGGNRLVIGKDGKMSAVNNQGKTVNESGLHTMLKRARMSTKPIRKQNNKKYVNVNTYASDLWKGVNGW